MFFLQVIVFNQNKGWLDFTQIPLVGDNNRLAIIYPDKQTNGEYFKHAVIVRSDGQHMPITRGKFEVIELLKWDVPTNYM